MFVKNFRDLIREAHKWEHTLINGKTIWSFYFTGFQYAFILIAVVCSLFVHLPSDNGLVDYLATGLSLFAGILFSLTITLYDRFGKVDFSQYHESISYPKSKEGGRLLNFYKKTISLSLYAAVLAISCVLLLVLVAVTPEDYSMILCEYINGFCGMELAYKIFVLLAYVLKSLTCYFLCDFIYITIHLITSFYDLIFSDINKVNLKQ